jgi:nitroimidazol reductase NimA-like FMN-containing flavoprotein (pyridoxamine 5'-phosphate oxidase superfamily)
MLGELTQQEITDLFEKSLIGRIGCNDGERTYVVPISYLFNGDHLVCHSRDGLKIEMMRKNPHVCFEVDEIRDYMHWRSAIAWGRYEELTNEHEIARVRTRFSEEMLNRKASLTSLPAAASEDDHRQKADFMKTVFYRIWITEVTGRFEKTDIPIT